jgi:hypothetical protein
MAPVTVKVEIYVSAAWVDITAYTYTRDDLEITRGRPDETATVDPSTCRFTLNNRDGRFSPRNPTSPYYGLIGRNTPARVTLDGSVRFVGEITAWPQRWDASGRDVYVPVEAAGVMRRLGQGATPLRSAPWRFALNNQPWAYWPLEDMTRAQFGAPGVGKYSFKLRRKGSSAVRPGEGELGAWLPNTVRLNETVFGAVCDATVKGLGATVTEWAVDLAYAGDNLGVVSFAVWDRNGNAIWRVRLDEATDEISLLFRGGGTGSGESVIAGPTSIGAGFDGDLHILRLWTNQDSPGTAGFVVYLDGTAVPGLTGTISPSVTQNGIGQVGLRGAVGSGDSNADFGHMAAWANYGAGGYSIPAPLDWIDAVYGHPGEPAGQRIQRLCGEEGIAFTAAGTMADTIPAGPQYADPFLDILTDAAQADFGILYEPRDAVGLAYRAHTDLYNQAPSLALDYDGRVFADTPEPVDDDQLTRNDVTADRRDGSSERVTLDTGPMSTLDPPAGVGHYDEQITLNVFADGKALEDEAGWRLHLGTADEARYPLIHLNLSLPAFTNNPTLTGNTVGLDVGDRFTIDNMPTWIPPDQVNLLAQGFTESVAEGGYRRDVIINCTPELPWRPLVVEAAAGSTVNKYDTGGSTLASGINTSATSLSVATASGHPVWTDDNAEDGFDIFVGGERMTVTDISGTTSPQTFTVTRSVNGVVKSHSSGALVRLWQTPVYGL